MITVYGLKTCDTCRKALVWLDAEGIAYRFHDLRADGISRDEVARLAKAAGWEKLLNKASTTWRGLDGTRKEGLTEARAIALMAEHPALLKRPVFDLGGTVLCGFRDAGKAVLKAVRR